MLGGDAARVPDVQHGVNGVVAVVKRSNEEEKNATNNHVFLKVIDHHGEFAWE